MKNKLLLFLFIIVVAKFNGQVTPATNYISMDISTSPQNAAFNYDSCFAIGDDIGMSSVGLFQNWTNIETAPLTYNFVNFDIANYYYPLHAMPIDLTIAPISTNNLEVPSDLVSVTFDDPMMISRFNKLLDSIKAHMPAVSLSSLVIGSEHDVYIGSNAILWNQYTTFYDSVTAHAKLLWPGLKVATELTFNGIINYNSFAQTLNTSSNYIGVSHYPLYNDFTVKPLSSLDGDFDTLVTLYPSKPICFYQYGYPSSTVCNSSDALQSQFISETFNVWDNHAANVRMIDFTWLHDLDIATVNYYSTYYGITDPAFLEFLRTLGLRNWNGNGSDKPSLNELRCQAKNRGFNTLPVICTMGIAFQPIFVNDLSILQTASSIEFVLNDKTNFIDIVTIYNVLGDEIKLLKQNNQSFSTIEFPKGIYFYQLLTNNNIPFTGKFIVQ